MENLGKYRILRRLGQGAMGKVYLAEHQFLHVKRAIKVLPEGLSTSDTFQERFLNEGQMLARLQHPHIVQVHDMDVENGVYYIAMDFVSPDGKHAWPMDALLKRNNGRMKSRDALGVLCQVCEAIGYAHEQDVIHCDIKPSNILVAGTHDIRVSDFGLSKVVGRVYLDESIKASLSGSFGIQNTQVPKNRSLSSEDSFGPQDTMAEGQKKTGQSLVGTFHYMPPEVQEGGEWTTRGDLYSIGVLSYVLVTGKRPVGKWKKPSEIIDDLPPMWDDLVETLLAGDPEERPENAKAVLGLLRRIKKPVNSRLVSEIPDTPEKEPESQGGNFFAKLVLVVVVLVLGGFAYLQYGLPSEKETVPETPTTLEIDRPIQVHPAPENTTEKVEISRIDTIEPELQQTEIIAREEESLEAYSDISQSDMQEMDYWAGIAEVQYAEAAAWGTRFREGSDNWNTRVKASISQAQQAAEQAKNEWSSIHKKYFKEQTNEEIDSAWLKAVENAQLARLQVESEITAQQNMEALSNYQEMEALKKEQKAREQQAALLLEQQRRANYQSEMEAYRQSQAIKHDQMRRHFSVSK